MRPHVWTAIGILFGTAAVSVWAVPPGQTTTPTTSAAVTAPPADVAALIRQLDADDWRDRDAAADRLVTVGEPARAAVTAAARVDGPEVRVRAVAVLARLDRIAAERPTVATFDLQNATFPDAMAAVDRQAPGLFDASMPLSFPAGMPRATLGLRGQPFWTAVRQVCDAYRVTPFCTDPDGRITLTTGGQNALAGPTSCADPRFVAVAQSAEWSGVRSYLPGGDAKVGGRLSIDLFVDPAVRALAATNVMLTMATDDRGRSLIATDDGRRLTYVSQTPTHLYQVSADLAEPSERATRIADLRGTVNVVAASRTEWLDVADVAAAVGRDQPVGPFTARLTKADLRPHEGAIELSVTYPRTAAAVEPGLGASQHTIRLTDATGRRMAGGSWTGGCHDGVLTYRMSYSSGPAARGPFRFTWNAPVAVEEHTVKIAFQDLLLP